MNTGGRSIDLGGSNEDDRTPTMSTGGGTTEDMNAFAGYNGGMSAGPSPWPIMDGAAARNSEDSADGMDQDDDSREDDLAFNFDENTYGFPSGFGTDGTSDLDLLQFLASDTSIAFAHT